MQSYSVPFVVQQCKCFPDLNTSKNSQKCAKYRYYVKHFLLFHNSTSFSVIISCRLPAYFTQIRSCHAVVADPQPEQIAESSIPALTLCQAPSTAVIPPQVSILPVLQTPVEPSSSGSSAGFLPPPLAGTSMTLAGLVPLTPASSCTPVINNTTSECSQRPRFASHMKRLPTPQDNQEQVLAANIMKWTHTSTNWWVTTYRNTRVGHTCTIQHIVVVVICATS